MGMYGVTQGMASDDLCKVKMQCERSDVVFWWPKSCKISPFLSMAAWYVAEKRFPWKICWGCICCDVIGLWPDLAPSILLPQVAIGCPISYATFQRNPPSGSEAILEKHMGVASSPPLHGQALTPFHSQLLYRTYIFKLSYVGIDVGIVHLTFSAYVPQRVRKLDIFYIYISDIFF